MRNMKKFLALVLAMMMILSVAVFNTSAAEEEADYTEAALFLNSLAVMQGDENGNLMLDAKVTRYQAALFFARSLTGKTGTDIWNGVKESAYFGDVTMYGTAIDYAYGAGVVKGRGNGVFGANDTIIYQDMVVMAVRALGYETADMQYPYGHIIAAEKIGLLENIDQVNYKAEMTRGETAQLINNMLKATIARIDPITDKVLYKDDKYVLADMNTVDDRQILMNKAGFIDGTSVKVILDSVKFWTAEELAKDETRYNHVTVITEKGEKVNVKVEDLGITEDTLKKSYLGLSAELYFSYADKKVDFNKDTYADEELAIVYVKYPTYTTVENLGNGTIKSTGAIDELVLTVGTEKFDLKKTWVTLKKWTNNGWADMFTGANAVADACKYALSLNYKNGEYTDATANTFGKVEYRTWTVDKQDYAEILVTPYDFAQYNERAIKYAGTNAEETFVTLATYTSTPAKDIAGNETYFANETLVGTTTKITEKTSIITKSAGKDVLDVTVEGSAKAGEFVIYDYNALDNVLTIAAVVGSIETGSVTGQNTSKNTVKIDGTNFNTVKGFVAPFGTNVVNKDKFDIEKAYKVEEGDNVQYLAYNGNLLFIANYEEVKEEAEVDFAIISTDSKRMAELLEVEVADYTASLTGGYYLDNGYVVVAMLNLTTGKWELANIKAVATKYEDGEYKDLVDLATLATYKDLVGSNYENADYKAAAAVVNNALFVAVVANEDGAYTIANDANVKANKGPFNLAFSGAGLSNKITADATVDEARIQTNENTVIVIVDTKTKEVAVRTGVMNAKADHNNLTAFYVADANLIVATTETLDAAWEKATLADDNINYYYVTPSYNPDIVYNKETKKYDVTVEGLYDLTTFAMADAITYSVDKSDDVKNFFTGKTVVTFNTATEAFGTDAMVTNIAEAVIKLHSADEDNALAIDTLKSFDDANSIEFATLAAGKNGVAVSNIAIKVATLDLTGYEWDEMDIEKVYTNVLVEDEPKFPGAAYETIDGKDYYAIEVVVESEVEEINAPTETVLDQFVIEMAGKTITVVEGDEDETTSTFKYSLVTVANYDKETDTVTAYVVKVLTK